MSADIKALTRRWFEEVWNKGRSEAIDELLSAEVVAHGLSEAGGVGRGPESFRRFWRQFRDGIPDVRVTVDQVIGEGDTTAARFTVRGTHSGDGLGVKATGRPIAVSGMCMMRWRDGQIAEGWNEFDAAGLMRQIGGPGGTAAQAPKVRT